jgi:hypothetical protein
MKEIFVPPVKWTAYGRWSDDGLRLYGMLGDVIYTHPELRKLTLEEQLRALVAEGPKK